MATGSGTLPAGASQRAKGCAGVAAVERDPGHGDPVAHRGEFAGRRGIGKEQPGFGVGRHVGDGLCCRRGRQRRHRHAGAQGAEEERRVFEGTAGADGD
jgi:hypothetical protein